MQPSKPDPARINGVLEAIRVVWEKYPENRLAQMLIGAAYSPGEKLDIEKLFFLTDEELVQKLHLLDDENQKIAEEWKSKKRSAHS